MTIAMLLRNCIDAAELVRRLSAAAGTPERRRAPAPERGPFSRAGTADAFS